jgi:hypothetical protein
MLLKLRHLCEHEELVNAEGMLVSAQTYNTPEEPL